ncbi:MAG: hypothetical protein GY940_43030, partial [bacterium]|nr:hypothetical protein [bacterium]
MQTLAHIVNPVKVSETSDLYIAQPITFETMKIAREACSHEINVKQFTCQYPEDRCLVPEGFTATPDLERSVLAVGEFKNPRKLPLIKDILDRLYDNTDALYLIYTNVDIGLQPYFYPAVSAIIQQGYDAFVINRRTIPTNYKSLEEIPAMYTEIGEFHKGWDCFIFERSLYPRFQLGTACIGAG